jgi:DNA-binding SARP family transcriptional activator
VQVSVLGSFQVVHRGVIITPSAPKLRQVLALLSVSANKVIGIDQIIDELWAERPPVSAMTTLQTYIYQLRKVFRTSGDDSPVLTTRPGGYLLRLAANSVDAHVFEQLAERGRLELGAGNVESAAETLRAALRGYRGQMLRDVPVGRLLHSETVRLEELRKSVLELRIAADLQLGRHHELIGELTNLVALHPTHEGFQANLMQALYTAGRRSESLQVYQRARDALARELGLEPSAVLQQLQRDVLSAAPSLDTRPAAGLAARSGKAVEPPAQLPANVPSVIGRDADEADLRDALTAAPSATPPVMLVSGPPGIGKTTLCVHSAHGVRSSFPDGQFYARLQSTSGAPVDPSDVLADFLRATGMPRDGLAGDLDERGRLFRSWTAHRRVLVVLDDVVDAEQLAPLLPTGSRCATLATTRCRMFAPSATGLVDLRPLGEADALALLVAELGNDRVVREIADAQHLVQLCGGSPQVLHAAATMLRVRSHWPIRRLVRRLANDDASARERLVGELGIGGSVHATCLLLPPAARAAFPALAGAAAEPLSSAQAATVLGVDEQAAESILESLVEFQLADVAPPGDVEDDRFRYGFSPLVRLVAAGRLEPALVCLDGV